MRNFIMLLPFMVQGNFTARRCCAITLIETIKDIGTVASPKFLCFEAVEPVMYSPVITGNWF